MAEVAPSTALYPYLAETLAAQVVGQDFDFADEFDFGLTLILDGLAEHLTRAVSGSAVT